MDSKLIKAVKALVGYILMGVAVTNCYIGWRPQSDQEWCMWAGNLLLGIVALVYIFKGPKLDKE